MIQDRPRQPPGRAVAAPEGPPYRRLAVRKLTPIIGAEIEGVDLSIPPDSETLAEIERAFAENLVIFFRDQRLTPAQHIAFGRLFGELHIHPAAPSEPGHPGLMIIAADETSSRANGEGWHTGCVLRSRAVDGQPVVPA
ncbi:TauD/TfdA family dioxygenase [Caulobacter sp. SLTY]|uniref:TauD/TfdA dioxygenase family protein n=1 Tax=Caulobacter sp. SLTY TaxID=2683262 RepID=UPI0023F4150A|nr:TauD/TfdA family dioxygenase [Caulobacter sp. SLTY]